MALFTFSPISISCHRTFHSGTPLLTVLYTSFLSIDNTHKHTDIFLKWYLVLYYIVHLFFPHLKIYQRYFSVLVPSHLW